MRNPSHLPHPLPIGRTPVSPVGTPVLVHATGSLPCPGFPFWVLSVFGIGLSAACALRGARPYSGTRPLRNPTIKKLCHRNFNIGLRNYGIALSTRQETGFTLRRCQFHIQYIQYLHDICLTAREARRENF